ncbi:hypothetical protein ADIS_0236 [Lunatimonas lonarensis]|uniref:Uncharacterized protein n=1 Tax=Lunatimonas lonarensis TaxID=1232681 RepID=R7ZYQ3_9BACT|nr:hypothetical protein ADIS_0236 [Lunatimonas lonarensis]
MSTTKIGIRDQGTDHVNNNCSLKGSHNVVSKVLSDPDEALL